MNTIISAENKAWLKRYCQDRARATAESDIETLAKVFEVFFYLGSICRSSSPHSLPEEINCALYGRDIVAYLEAVLGTGAQP